MPSIISPLSAGRACSAPSVRPSSRCHRSKTSSGSKPRDASRSATSRRRRRLGAAARPVGGSIPKSWCTLIRTRDESSAKRGSCSKPPAPDSGVERCDASAAESAIAEYAKARCAATVHASGGSCLSLGDDETYVDVDDGGGASGADGALRDETAELLRQDEALHQLVASLRRAEQQSAEALALAQTIALGVEA